MEEREEEGPMVAGTESKVRAAKKKKSEIDRGRREMEASGSTRRVHGYFENSINLAPATSPPPSPPRCSPSRPTPTSQPRRTHRPLERDEISSSSQSLVIPGTFWAPAIPRVFLPEESSPSPASRLSGLDPHSAPSSSPTVLPPAPLSSSFFYPSVTHRHLFRRHAPLISASRS